MASDIKIVKSHRRTIALHIEPDGTVVVKAPKLMFDFQIRQFVASHKDWIDKHVEKRHYASHSREQGTYLYLGKTLQLDVGNYLHIAVKGDVLQFPEALVFRKEKELHDWYIRQAREIITTQTEYYAQRMKTSYKEITFSDTRSQWGRCTHDNRLQFNWRLVMAPLMVINYVVIHELSHTMEKNHTQMFWMKVRSQNPSYRQQIKWLKDHGASLRI
jgi:predicted metal-dependent hydrolase